MKKRYAVLTAIENEGEISEDTNPAFMYLLKKALLLALRERGFLNEVQYRHADESLLQQRQSRARALRRRREGEE